MSECLAQGLGSLPSSRGCCRLDCEVDVSCVLYIGRTVRESLLGGRNSGIGDSLSLRSTFFLSEGSHFVVRCLLMGFWQMRDVLWCSRKAEKR